MPTLVSSHGCALAFWFHTSVYVKYSIFKVRPSVRRSSSARRFVRTAGNKQVKAEAPADKAPAAQKPEKAEAVEEVSIPRPAKKAAAPAPEAAADEAATPEADDELPSVDEIPEIE